MLRLRSRLFLGVEEDFGATIGDAERCVWQEAERRVASGVPVRGVCAFNRQDAESAAFDGALHMSFAAFPEAEPTSNLRVGRELRAALEKRGLQIEWHEEPGSRVGVIIQDWRVRRFTGDWKRRSLFGWTRIWGEIDDHAAL